MPTRVGIIAGVVLGILSQAPAMRAAAPAPATRPASADATAKRDGGDVFGDTKLWTVHIRLTADRWEMLQPGRANRGPGQGPGPNRQPNLGERIFRLFDPRRGAAAPAPPAVQVARPAVQPATRPSTQPTLRPAAVPAVRSLEVAKANPAPATASSTRPANGTQKAPPPEGERLARNPFGYQYAYVRSVLEMDGEVCTEVGLRFKGNSSYGFGAHGLKRPFKVDFDRFVEGQDFHGLSTFNLQNNAYDPTLLREAVSYAVFRDAGIPAPRTGFAMVYVTVDGLHDRELAGFYTIIEEVDKQFLKRHFGNAKGLLLKPEGMRGLPYMGENWASYAERLRPKEKEDPAHTTRFIEFLKLINQADDARFAREIDSYVAVDSFLRFLAVNALLSNLDSYLGTGHNYYMYLNPGDNKVYFLPWDLNLSFGGWGSVSSGPNQADLSVDHPHIGENKLIDRILAIDANKRKYREYVRTYTRDIFSVKRMDERIDAMEAVVESAAKAAKAAGKEEKHGDVQMGGLGRPKLALKEFVQKRVESVELQLAGKTEGYVPNFGRPGLPGGPRGRIFPQQPMAGRPAVPLALPVAFLRAVDANKDRKLSQDEWTAALRRFFNMADQEKSGFLKEESLLLAIQGVLPSSVRPTTLPSTRPAAQPSSPAGRVVALTGRISFKEGDQNRDKRLSVPEFLAVGIQAFEDADKDRSKFLEESEIIEAFSRLATMPIPVEGR